jgi:hypothetical protein
MRANIWISLCFLYLVHIEWECTSYVTSIIPESRSRFAGRTSFLHKLEGNEFCLNRSSVDLQSRAPSDSHCVQIKGLNQFRNSLLPRFLRIFSHCDHVLRIRGGRIKGRERLQIENERVAELALKRLKPNPYFEVMGMNQEKEISNCTGVDESELDFVEEEAKRRSTANARSLLWEPVQRTAVCIVLPEDVWPTVQSVRMEHDRWINRWFHPVILLLHPFFPVEFLAEAAEAMQTRLRSNPQLTIRMEELSVCTHASSSTLRLLPDAASRASLEALHVQLISLFPTLQRNGNNEFDGDAAPHIVLGHFDSDREATAVADQLRAEGWRPIEFKVEELMVMAREAEAGGRENLASGRSPFESLRSVILGIGEERVEAGPISEAEANLDGSDEPPAVVQEWDPVAGRFCRVRGGELAELERQAQERRREQRRARAEKTEDEARDFFNEPSRQAEARRAAIPDAAVANVTALLGHVGPGGDGSVLTAFVHEYKRRFGVSLTRLAGDLDFRGAGQLLRALPDVVRLSRRRADVFVHRAAPLAEREQLWRAAGLRKELAAMKRRAVTESSAARGTNRRVRLAEGRVMRRFAQRVGAEDAALVEEQGYRQVDRARDARFGPLRADPDSPYYDPEAARFAADLDAARRGAEGGGSARSEGGQRHREAAAGAEATKEKTAERQQTKFGAEKGTRRRDMERDGSSHGTRRRGSDSDKQSEGPVETEAGGHDSDETAGLLEGAVRRRLIRRQERRARGGAGVE